MIGDWGGSYGRLADFEPAWYLPMWDDKGQYRWLRVTFS